MDYLRKSGLRFLLLLEFGTLGAVMPAPEIKIGIILMNSAPEPFDVRRVGPAIDIALETANKNFGVNMTTVLRAYSGDHVCEYEPPVGLLAELYSQDNVKGVLGPACSQGLQASGRLAQYLNIPMVTGLGDLIVRQKPVDMYKTLTILSYNLQKLSCKYIKVFQTAENSIA